TGPVQTPIGISFQSLRTWSGGLKTASGRQLAKYGRSCPSASTTSTLVSEAPPGPHVQNELCAETTGGRWYRPPQRRSGPASAYGAVLRGAGAWPARLRAASGAAAAGASWGHRIPSLRVLSGGSLSRLAIGSPGRVLGTIATMVAAPPAVTSPRLLAGWRARV